MRTRVLIFIRILVGPPWPGLDACECVCVKFANNIMLGWESCMEGGGGGAGENG